MKRIIPFEEPEPCQTDLAESDALIDEALALIYEMRLRLIWVLTGGDRNADKMNRVCEKAESFLAQFDDPLEARHG